MCLLAILLMAINLVFILGASLDIVMACIPVGVMVIFLTYIEWVIMINLSVITWVSSNLMPRFIIVLLVESPWETILIVVADNLLGFCIILCLCFTFNDSLLFAAMDVGTMTALEEFLELEMMSSTVQCFSTYLISLWLGYPSNDKDSPSCIVQDLHVLVEEFLKQMHLTLLSR